MKDGRGDVLQERRLVAQSQKTKSHTITVLYGRRFLSGFILNKNCKGIGLQLLRTIFNIGGIFNIFGPGGQRPRAWDPIGPQGPRGPTLNLMGLCSLNFIFLAADERITFGASSQA